jgi:carboxyl-terminal processing protease
MKLTDSGRRVFGGDGITPDYCVEPETASKFVSHLVARQALTSFARGFEAAGGQEGGSIAGTGSRTASSPARVKKITPAFVVDDAVLVDFRAHLDERKIRYTEAELAEHREELARRIEEEVVLQVFGEGEARRRSAAWDPQVRKALELVPRAEQLLRDPRAYVAERERERQLADAAPGGSPARP